MDLSKLKKAELIELVESLEAERDARAETLSVGDEVMGVVAGRVLSADERAKLAVALNLAEILDSGSVHLASAGIAKQVLSIIEDLAVEPVAGENPLAAVLSLAKSG